MNADYDTIIWDWNGTLLDDLNLCIEIANELLRNHNDLQLDYATYREVFGFPITAYYERIGIDLEKEPFVVLTEKFMHRYGSGVLNCGLHTGASSILQTFRNREINQYILTAAHKDSVCELLDHFSIADYFIEIEGLDNHRAESKVDRGKALVRDNAIDRCKTVLIGDTIHDKEVADQLGIDCILIANGHQSKGRLLSKAKHNRMVFDRVEQLTNVF